MKFEKTWTGNWENAFRGLRHPFESYAKSDSAFGIAENDIWLDDEVNEVAQSYIDNWNDERVDPKIEYIKSDLYTEGILYMGKENAEYALLGAKDLELAQRMIKAGTPNDKFLRQIFVSVDITAPLYFLKELDTYKIGTTANSTSTMHKLASTPITLNCFEIDDYNKEIDFPCELNGNSIKYPISIETGVNNIISFCENLRQKYLETKDIRYWKELIRWLPESWLQTRTWTANYAILRNIIHWRKGHKLTEWKNFLDWASKLPYADDLLFFEN